MTPPHQAVVPCQKKRTIMSRALSLSRTTVPHRPRTCYGQTLYMLQATDLMMACHSQQQLIDHGRIGRTTAGARRRRAARAAFRQPGMRQRATTSLAGKPMSAASPRPGPSAPGARQPVLHGRRPPGLGAGRFVFERRRRRNSPKTDPAPPAVEEAPPRRRRPPTRRGSRRRRRRRRAPGSGPSATIGPTASSGRWCADRHAGHQRGSRRQREARATNADGTGPSADAPHEGVHDRGHGVGRAGPCRDGWPAHGAIIPPRYPARDPCHHRSREAEL